MLRSQAVSDRRGKRRHSCPPPPSHPALPQVRGADGLRAFSQNLLQPYSAQEPSREALLQDAVWTEKRLAALLQQLGMSQADLAAHSSASA